MLLIAADRGTVWLATRRVHDQLLAASGAHGPAGAKIGGVPFLTQVIGGHYDDLSVHLASVETAGVRLRDVDVRLHGVHVGALAALLGRVRDVPIDHVDGTATMTYADLQTALRRISLGFTVVEVSGDSRGIRLTLPLIGALGRPDSTQVDAVVTNGRLQLRLPVRGPDPVATALAQVALPLPPLPYGLRLQQVRYDSTGVHFTVTGKDASLPSR